MSDVSIATSTEVSKPPTWFQKNRVTLSTVAAVMGLGMGLFSLGVIVASMGTSSHWYYTFRQTDGSYNDCPDYDSNGMPFGYSESGGGCYGYFGRGDIPESISNAHDIQTTSAYGAVVGGIALGPCIAGFVIFVVALIARYKKEEKKSEERNKTEVTDVNIEDTPRIAADAKAKRQTYILFGLGFMIAIFSLGMLVSGSLIQDHGVSHMQHLVDQGRVDNPHPQYDPDFWDHVQSDWVDPTHKAMSGMIAAGTIGFLAGGALITVAALRKFGHGFFSCIRDCGKKDGEKENQAETPAGAAEQL